MIVGMAATTHLTAFGSWLRALRKRNRLTLKIVGEMTGKHFADVQKIETGVRLPDADFCVALVNGLGTMGIPVDLNDVLRMADLKPVQGRAGVGGTAAQASFTAEPSDRVGERNAAIEYRQWLIQQIRTALADSTLDDETFEALSRAIIALRQSLEKSSAPKRHGPDRENGTKHRAAGGAIGHYSIST